MTERIGRLDATRLATDHDAQFPLVIEASIGDGRKLDGVERSGETATRLDEEPELVRRPAAGAERASHLRPVVDVVEGCGEEVPRSRGWRTEADRRRIDRRAVRSPGLDARTQLVPRGDERVHAVRRGPRRHRLQEVRHLMDAIGLEGPDPVVVEDDETHGSSAQPRRHVARHELDAVARGFRRAERDEVEREVAHPCRDELLDAHAGSRRDRPTPRSLPRSSPRGTTRRSPAGAAGLRPARRPARGCVRSPGSGAEQARSRPGPDRPPPPAGGSRRVPRHSAPDRPRRGAWRATSRPRSSAAIRRARRLAPPNQIGGLGCWTGFGQNGASRSW